MRPRVFPAEDDVYRHEAILRALASMRPRVFPAEDCPQIPHLNPDRAGFNEAAGIPRGRPLHEANEETQMAELQ